jgi:hypothetical protein
MTIFSDKFMAANSFSARSFGASERSSHSRCEHDAAASSAMEITTFNIDRASSGHVPLFQNKRKEKKERA